MVSWLSLFAQKEPNCPGLGWVEEACCAEVSALAGLCSRCHTNLSHLCGTRVLLLLLNQQHATVAWVGCTHVRSAALGFWPIVPLLSNMHPPSSPPGAYQRASPQNGDGLDLNSCTMQCAGAIVCSIPPSSSSPPPDHPSPHPYAGGRPERVVRLRPEPIVQCTLNDDGLANMFSDIGPVKSAFIVYDIETKKSRGFGLVWCICCRRRTCTSGNVGETD